MCTHKLLPLALLFSLSLVFFSPDSGAQVSEQSITEISDVTPEQVAQQWAENFLASLTPQTGTIELPGGIASLEVPENFYYLSPADAKRVLEDAWENPESELGLGMLFPAQYTPLDSTAWGVTLEYEAEGYVSDKDAADIDYDDLMSDMQADASEASDQRVEAGYEAISLVGWAAPPHYDTTSHKLYWAKELKFGDAQENTLNYNVRVLGREGVLVLNFIAGMPQLAEIEAARDDVLAMTSFNQGNRYSEFDPDVDHVAAYGLGGLIAGKVLAKTGLLAIGLVFLKKFWFFILLPLAWLKNLIFKKKEA